MELTERECARLVCRSRLDVLQALGERVCRVERLKSPDNREIVTLENLRAAVRIPQDPPPLNGRSFDVRAHPLGFGIVELTLPAGVVSREELEGRFGPGTSLPIMPEGSSFPFLYKVNVQEPRARCSMFAYCTGQDLRASVVEITFRTESEM
jgi:hypothetical protein